MRSKYVRRTIQIVQHGSSGRRSASSTSSDTRVVHLWPLPSPMPSPTPSPAVSSPSPSPSLASSASGEDAPRGTEYRKLWVPVTPQMLLLALKNLSSGNRPQTEDSILTYIMERYPLREKAQAQQEVSEKLRCACAVGLLQRFGTKKYKVPRHKGGAPGLSPQEVESFWRQLAGESQPSCPATPPPLPPEHALPATVTRLRHRSGSAIPDLAPAPTAQASSSIICIDEDTKGSSEKGRLKRKRRRR